MITNRLKCYFPWAIYIYTWIKIKILNQRMPFGRILGLKNWREFWRKKKQRKHFHLILWSAPPLHLPPSPPPGWLYPKVESLLVSPWQILRYGSYILSTGGMLISLLHLHTSCLSLFLVTSSSFPPLPAPLYVLFLPLSSWFLFLYLKCLAQCLISNV